MASKKPAESLPLVSVIIPFSRPLLAKAVLEELVRQTYPAELTEILLVGANSKSLAELYPIKAIETPPIYYPGVARNIGARSAAGRYLLFLDDDCEPAPDWIEQNVRLLEGTDFGAVGGQISGKSRAFFARCVDFSRFGFSQSNKAAITWVCSASLGVKRTVFEQVQGFNEELRSEEDIDFCYRLMRAGYKTAYQPAIKVRHDHRRTSFIAMVRYSYFYGRVSGLYVKRLYTKMSFRNAMLTSIQNPLLYPLMIVPVSLGATLNIVRLNIREYPAVMLYAPFIFLSKAATNVGIWLWLLCGQPIAVDR
ncbi:MAG TPA: glycosyltransferase [Ktedonobacteraceae bacterium]|nr:glycosyltransferase [Ktedonobacteraceae bacterium]